MENVAADEQRHIGFGVKLLSDLREMDPEVPHAVAELLREVVPWTVAVLVPPDWDMRYIECFGFTLEDIGEEGADLARDQDAQRRPADRGAARPARIPRARHRTRARRARPQDGARRLPRREARPAVATRADMAIFFETIAGGAGLLRRAAEPGAIQWDFRDAEPWHVVVANGATSRRARAVALCARDVQVLLRGLRGRGRR